MDYQGNTDKDKEARAAKQVVKVVTGEVVKKPESLGRKFKSIFFGGDLKTSAKYVAADVLLPSFRNLLLDAIVNGAKGYIMGDPAYRRRDPEYRPRIQYSNPINRPSTTYQDVRRGAYLPGQPHPYRQSHIDRSEYALERKEDAEVVVERLIDIVDQYQVASLADYYSLLGYASTPIDNKWGWSSLNNIEIRQDRDGYHIELPPLEAI